MRIVFRIMAPILLASSVAQAGPVQALPSTDAPATTVQPPPGRPHAFTPAPVPAVGPSSVAPANRAGNASDAGPINATPLSASLSGSLGTGVDARAVQQTAPDADPVPSPAGHD